LNYVGNDDNSWWMVKKHFFNNLPAYKPILEDPKTKSRLYKRA